MNNVPQVQIRSDNLEITDAIRSYIDKKVSQLAKFTRTKEGSTTLEIEIAKERAEQNNDDLFRAEINALVDGQFFRYSANAGDLYAALDLMKDGIIRELTQTQNKKRDLIRRGAAAAKRMLRRWQK